MGLALEQFMWVELSIAAVFVLPAGKKGTLTTLGVGKETRDFQDLPFSQAGLAEQESVNSSC